MTRSNFPVEDEEQSQSNQDGVSELPEQARAFQPSSVPLPPVRPTIRVNADASDARRSLQDGDGDLEERDSYAKAPDYPYHPANWGGRLPGPGIASSDDDDRRAAHLDADIPEK